MKKLNHKLIMLLAPFAIMAGISTTTIAHADSGWDSGWMTSTPNQTAAQKAQADADGEAADKAGDAAAKASADNDKRDVANIIAEDKAKGIDPNTDDRLAQNIGIDYNNYNPWTDDGSDHSPKPVYVPAKTTTKKTAKNTVKKVVIKKKVVAKKTVKKVHTIKTVKKIYAYKSTNTKYHVGRKAIKKGTKYHVVKTVKVGKKTMYEIKGHRFVTANAKYVLIVR